MKFMFAILIPLNILVSCNDNSVEIRSFTARKAVQASKDKKLNPPIIECDYSYTGGSPDDEIPTKRTSGFPLKSLIDKKRNYTRTISTNKIKVDGVVACQILQTTNYDNIVIEEVSLICDDKQGSQRTVYSSSGSTDYSFSLECTRKSDGVVTKRKRVDGAAVAIVSYGYDVFQVKDNKKIHSYSASLEDKKRGPLFEFNNDNGQTLFSISNLGLEAEVYKGNLSMHMRKSYGLRFKPKNGNLHSHAQAQYGERCDIDNDTLYTIKYNFKNYPDKNLKVVHFCNVKEREF